MTKLGRGTLAWVFGLALSVFLIAVWGRATVVDSESLGLALAPAAESVAVADAVGNWLRDELVDAGLTQREADAIVRTTAASPSASRLLDDLVSEFVAAAAAADPADAVIDLEPMLRPLVPEISEALSAALDDPVPVSEVESAIDDLDPIVVRAEGTRPLIGPDSPAASRLGTAAIGALMALVLAGWGLVMLSEDRLEEVRRLASRVALGALSFAVLLMLGSWVLSPTGGRAPIAATLSAVAGAKFPVLLGVAAAGAGVAVLAYLIWLRFKPRAVFPTEGESPTRREEPALSSTG